MPICRKCETPFPNHQIIDGIRRTLNSRKRCLSCSPFGKHDTTPVGSRRQRENSDGHDCRCGRCGKSYLYQRSKGMRLDCCASCVSVQFRKDLKQKCIDYKGGKCIRCEFSGHNAAMSFHHRDRSTKLFTIAGAHCRAWGVLKEELDKCDLLCHNCHAVVEVEIAEEGLRANIASVL